MLPSPSAMCLAIAQRISRLTPFLGKVRDESVAGVEERGLSLPEFALSVEASERTIAALGDGVRELEGAFFGARQ